MPDVAEEAALNRPFLDLDALAHWNGPPPWRTCLVSTPGLLVVLFHWPAGFVTGPNTHGAEEEIFQVLRGTAMFTIGNVPEREARPGEFIFVKRGTRHSIRVSEDAPVTLLVATAPNDDRGKETA
jgi:quercetin dioxygenase-like cupin family protein